MRPKLLMHMLLETGKMHGHAGGGHACRQSLHTPGILYCSSGATDVLATVAAAGRNKQESP
eukprot:557628-Pelagomonas_calceolata.AAC.3